MEQPSASRCFQPPERLPASSPSRPSSPAIAISSSIRGATFRGGHLVDPGVELQVLPDGQILVEGELLGHVADVLLHPVGLGDDVEAGHPACAGWSGR